MRTEQVPERTLNPPAEALACYACDESCSEEDPVWRGRQYHLDCLDSQDWQDIAACVQHGTEEALVEAIEVYEQQLDRCRRELESKRKLEEIGRKLRCHLCFGAKRVCVTREPMPTYAACACVEGSSR